jgi:hypothetical protein
MIGWTANMAIIRNLVFALLSTTAWINPASAQAPDASAAKPVIPVEQTNPIALALDPGDWREYRLTGGPADGATLRWLWLETEEHDGQTYQWFETQFSAPGKRLVTKMLANPARLGEAPRVVLMKADDRPAQSMPGELRQKAVELLNYAGQQPAKSVEQVSIEVPAGSYATTFYSVVANGVNQKTYISESLPGIVLIETEEFRMELIALGDDGVSAITEPPATL